MESLQEAFAWIHDPSLIISQILSGLSISAFLLLVSLGLNLIFGLSRILNLAHGSYYMLGAYLMVTLSHLSDSIYAFAGFIVSVFLIAAALGSIFEMSILRRIYKKGAQLQLVVTFGMMLVIDTGIRLIWGTDFKSVTRPPALDRTVTIWQSPTPLYNVIVLAVVPLLTLALVLTFKLTKWGLKVRAASADAEMLDALGTNVNTLLTQVYSVSAGLAGLAGAMAAPAFSVDLNMGMDVISNSLAVVVIGGLGSLLGSALGSFIVGQLLAFGILIFPSLSAILIYALMFLVLSVRPRGLFGTAEGRVEEIGSGQ